MDLTAQQAYEALKDPRRALPLLGKVFDKKTSRFVDYDPFRLTHRMQWDILSYFGDPPRHEVTNQTLWMNVLSSRQGGKSTVPEYAAYVKTANNPGWEHICIADNDGRANALHNRVQQLHRYWPEEFRQLTVSTNETRQLTFKHGGHLGVLSGRSRGVGVGLSPNSLHISETGFWADAGYAMSLIQPALITQDDALLLQECTPTTDREPSTEYWKSIYFQGKARGGRWFSMFYPFWDTKTNSQPWQKGDTFTNEELDLLAKYGPMGMTPDNLAFRRYIMDSDSEIRRNPELFKVYYPFDDTTCWVTVASGFMRSDILEKRDHRLVPDNGEEYQEFEAPQPDGAYLIGVDPAGWGVNHGAFTVLRCWADAGEEVVATFSTPGDPLKFDAKLLETARRYNNAVVVVERNGVGAGTIKALQLANYYNIYMDDNQKPGVHKFSEDQMLAPVTDALLDTLVLRSQRIADQIVSYQGDKGVESTSRTIILAKGRNDPKRRDREHWDLFSSLCVAYFGRGMVPSRYKYREQTATNLIPFNQMGYDAIQQYLLQTQEPKHRRFRPRGRR